MAAPARSEARPAVGETGGAPRSTVPPRVALRPSRERRPGGPTRPAPKPAPPRPRRRAATPSRGNRLGDGVRSVRPTLVLDRLLRGRAWVALIAVLLAGIVFLNVALLEINGSIARMDERAADLKRDNAALRMRVARLGSSERIMRAAGDRGFVPAAPGSVGYLATRPGDASAAAHALERWPASPPPASTGPRTSAPAGATAADGAPTGSSPTATAGSPSTATTGSQTAGGDSSAATAPAGPTAAEATEANSASSPGQAAGTASP